MQTKNAILIINVDQELFPDQITLLNRNYASFKRLNIPMNKYTKDIAAKVTSDLLATGDDIIVRSTLPILMAEFQNQKLKFKVLHNETRTKKILKSGKIIYPVSRFKWELV